MPDENEITTLLAAMRDAGAFTVQDPRFTTARVVGPSMLSLDGPEHDRHRAPFVAPLRLGAVRDCVSAGRGHPPAVVLAAEDLVGDLGGDLLAARLLHVTDHDHLALRIILTHVVHDTVEGITQPDRFVISRNYDREKLGHSMLDAIYHTV